MVDLSPKHHDRGGTMKIRIPHSRRALTGGALALLAIAGVGATTAAASHASTPAPPPVSSTASTPDTPTPGDTQDTSTANEATEAPEADTGAPDTDNVDVQQGPQDGPDTGGADTTN
jgi:hypothetical protein